MKRAWWILLLSACGEASTGPAPLALGEDACDVCRMIISELPYAAQLRQAGGAVAKFDDLGCLAERLKKGPVPAEVWIVDHPSGRWIDARRAVYVRRKGLKTPMASELAAFEAPQAAASFSERTFGFEEFSRLGRPD